MQFNSLIGLTVGGYKVGELIGSGGMASVYRASTASGRAVALKVLCPVSASDQLSERFAREAIWLSRCADPHIVPIYAAGFDRGVHYLAMELLVTTLQHEVGTRPSLAKLVEIGAGILIGLSAAHRVGVIHGDLKPANVGVDAAGTIKLLDFGAANPLPWSSSITEEATRPVELGCTGTLHYLPPEQLRGDDIDERADLYGTGAVLYEIATGRRPFTEHRVPCLIDAILNRTPPPPSRFNARLTSAIDAILLKALAKSPADRFKSVHHMMDALLEANDPLDARTRREAIRDAIARDSRDGMRMKRLLSMPAERRSDDPPRSHRATRCRIDATFADAGAVR